MAEGKNRDEGRQETWRRIIRGHARSGLTIRRFCRENGLTESAFYFWRRELQRRQAQRAQQQRGRAKRPPGQGVPAFVPVCVAEQARPDAAGIEIVLSGGRRVHVTAPVDRQALADVVAVLEARPC